MKTHIMVFAIACILAANVATAQIEKNFKMVNASVDIKGELVIKASANSSKHDFDFLSGEWTMDNRRLKCRLNGCTEWIEYKSSDKNWGSMLNGQGNVDLYKTSYNMSGNTPYEGLTIRLFDPNTHLWSLYWVDSNIGKLDPPVVGSFEGDVGTFYCKDVFQGKKILVMFKWDKTDPDNPVWSQAFSEDNGKSWEMNMTNVSHRIPATGSPEARN
ncbi:hypothetical protein WBG78_09275 [Chryseolinea sp. T2]|uniref:hypothetical protein n=1 Tax=Chryseolinea sp. T2 TaxID=3129255 RepID=UPI0030789180